VAVWSSAPLVALLDAYDLVVVATANPFWLEHIAESWRHEKGCLNIAGRVVDSLPYESANPFL